MKNYGFRGYIYKLPSYIFHFILYLSEEEKWNKEPANKITGLSLLS